jgi:hypothetical protein
MADETPEAQIARLTGQVSDLTTANADLTGQLSTRTGELRSVRHRAAFKEVALQNGVRPKAVDSLYRLSGYDPGEADEADPVALTALIEAAREEHDYCFEPPAPAVVAPAVPAPEKKPTGFGSARGKAPASAAGKFRVTMADTADPKWLQDHATPYGEAIKNGTLEFVD